MEIMGLGTIQGSGVWVFCTYWDPDSSWLLQGCSAGWAGSQTLTNMTGQHLGKNAPQMLPETALQHEGCRDSDYL